MTHDNKNTNGLKNSNLTDPQREIDPNEIRGVSFQAPDSDPIPPSLQHPRLQTTATPIPNEGEILPPQNQNQNQNSGAPKAPPRALLSTPTTTTNDGSATSGTQLPQPAVVHTLDQLPSTIAGPLRSIQYSSVRDHVTLLSELQRTIPLNELGLPAFLYRPDLLNPTDFQAIPSAERARELQQMLSNAIVHISYAQGFPTFNNGMPIWAQLEWETPDAYMAFTEYLEEQGIRSLHNMISHPPDDLREWFGLTYWTFRSKAFDLYKAAHHARKRSLRIMAAEDDHYSMAEKMLKPVVQRMNRMTQEEWDNLEPLAAANIMEKLVKIQRVSLGLNAMGGDDPKAQEQRKVTTVEVAMKRVAAHSNEENTRQQDSREIDLLRDAPDAADIAQEIILRISQQQSDR